MDSAEGYFVPSSLRTFSFDSLVMSDYTKKA
jgi:hypothetical protein